jgi:hypothetical protein
MYDAAMRWMYPLLPLLPLLLLSACASSRGPEQLGIDPADYHDAFDAAMEASRIYGMPPLLRDRRQGVIETEPSLATSILEPWGDDNATLSQAVQNTRGFQRRRARFEFAPADESSVDAWTPPANMGPDLLGVETPGLDLSAYDGELELRVHVYVERAYSLGIRRSTWARRDTTRAWIDAPHSNGAIPKDFWTPVSRDEMFERRLLAAVDRSLQERAAE